jgi:hypothetical protein
MKRWSDQIYEVEWTKKIQTVWLMMISLCSLASLKHIDWNVWSKEGVIKFFLELLVLNFLTYRRARPDLGNNAL